MKAIQVFDPALCCSTGVCGVDVDQALVSFAADVDWAKQQGAEIERFNLAQQPMSFAENAIVKGFLERAGQEALPLTLIDGELALAGRYPSRADLARWAGIELQAADPKQSSGCCAPAKQAPVAESSCCSGSKCC
ncbi:MAG: arsenite efflux transporter metallochaperone ArsD [Pigmentiphaga sp.]